MSEEAKLLVLPAEGRPGYFRLTVTNPEFPHLTDKHVTLIEEEMRTLLADQFGKSPSEIESLIKRGY